MAETKKWLGLAAVGAALAGMVAKIRRRKPATEQPDEPGEAKATDGEEPQA